MVELTQPRRGGGGGSGRAVPRCRHIGCVVSHGAAAMSCCVRVIGTCVTCAGCAGCATVTRRGGGGGGGGTIGKCAAARAVTWVSSGVLTVPSPTSFGFYPRDLQCSYE